MDYVSIGIDESDTKVYDVIVTGIKESFNILYSENTGRSISPGARMVLDPLGTFYGHTVTFARMPGHEDAFDELFEFFSQPRYSGFYVEIVHNQEVIKYEAYVSNGERELLRIDKQAGKVYWKSFSVNIIPMEAQVTPE